VVLALPVEAPVLGDALGAAEASSNRDFAALDERVASGDGGVLLVHVVDDRTIEALRAHLVRRVRTSCSLVVSSRRSGGDAVWREVAARLGVSDVECAPVQCAAQLASVTHGRRVAILLSLPTAGSWDRAVTTELSQPQHDGRLPLVIILVPSIDPVRDVHGEVYEVSPSLDDADKRRWLATLAGDAMASLKHDDLVGLESWWAAAKHATPRSFVEDVPAEGRSLFVALALSGRGWHEHDLPLLGSSAAALRALEVAGLAWVDRGFFTLAPDADTLADSLGLLAARTAPETCTRIGKALEHRFPRDAWAHARAASLFLRGGNAELADDVYGRALASADDGLARREVVAVWMHAVEQQTPRDQLPLRKRAAERALDAGQADEAYRWAKGAAALINADGAEDISVTLLLGRAAVAMGDLVTARVALERARGAVNDQEMQASIAAELAEVAYAEGKSGEAEAQAKLALRSTRAVTCLRARNTIGKLLLADARWEEAERHFADDAHVAAAAGEPTSELRARVNRAVALLSRGQLEEAERIFATVLDDGERTGDHRAAAFALHNLAVVATWRHEYGDALELTERTLQKRLRIGDRLMTASVLDNLADLRGKVGLLDHADHAVAFGRRLLGPGMPPTLAVRFSIHAARLALVRGRTALAQREVSKALTEHNIHVGELPGGAHRIAARIALEDGDVARATDAITRARELATTDFARAEVALLDVLLARAKGEVSISLVDGAVNLARVAGEEELLREVHVVASRVHLACGEVECARAHIEQAIAVRDAVARTLRADVRAAFLARRDTQLLDELVVATRVESARASDQELDAEGPRTQRSPTSPPARHMIGDDPAIRALLAAIRKVARTDSTVLVHGESGTGKELVAEALHRSSERAHAPFVALNCAALVETLLLSELFGHEKGAFTGAVARRRGRFELAEGGTLFLDEIGEISPRTQVALLRVLQERTFERVGGTTSIRTNCRIICATHRDLKAMVERGEFREDLYYRLRGITLDVPALRARIGDLPRIAENLLSRIAVERSEAAKTLSPDAVELLMRHTWPGNVRELDNALRAASLFAESSFITANDFRDNVEDLRTLGRSPSTPPASPLTIIGATTPANDDDDGGTLPQDEAGATAIAYACVRQGSVSLSDLKRQIERDCVARALAETHGNITRAAALLGMKRPRLSQLVKQYGLTAVSTESQS
jgi:transcriptional regulator with GAF, ATPase, and Fis domain/tetratricopeptide (TPR) repeat protein